MLFGSGIDRFGCLVSVACIAIISKLIILTIRCCQVDAAELCGVIQRRGSWYYRDDLKLAQGRSGAVEVIKAGGDAMIRDLELRVKQSMGNKDTLLKLTSGTTVVSGVLDAAAAEEGEGGFDDDRVSLADLEEA